MIAFATLWLGIVTGVAPVELLVGPEVARVELRLDGELVAELAGPPWRASCDLGPEIAPHELVATAYDAAGRRAGEARQRLNLPRPPAELEVALEPAVGATVARLAWGAAGGAPPTAVRVWLDGEPLAVPPDPRRLELPGGDPERPRLLRIEAEFPHGAVATRELVLGGTLSEEAQVELTGVPVELGARAPRRGAGLRLVAGEQVLPAVSLEEGLADLVAVVDPGAREALATLARRGSRRRVRAASGGTATRSVPTSVEIDPERTLAPLARDHRLRLVLPVAGRSGDAVLRYELFPISPELTPDTGLLDSLLASGRAAGDATGGRLADAVALAALTAGERGRRRLVLLVVDGDGADESLYAPARVRRYLARLRVPLVVWSTGEPSAALLAAWGEVEPVDDLAGLERAARALGARLARQRIAWVEGSHLPQQLALHPAVEGLSLAGELPPREMVAGEPAVSAGSVDPEPARGDALARANGPTSAAELSRGGVPSPLADGDGDSDGDGDGAGADAIGQPATAGAAGLATTPLGPFTAFSDVVDRRLLARLGAVATALPAAFTARFGLAAPPGGRVLVFRREAAFRDWLADEGGPADAGLEGFAESGSAALYVGDRRADEVAGLLVHELTHLLTRAAVGRPLPPWLEEGLAEDLAMSRLDGAGRPQPGTLRMTRTVRPMGGVGAGRPTAVERTVEGPVASLVRLVSSPGARVPLAVLLAATPEGLVAPAGRQERYATAAFLVRFLLAPGEGRADRFRAFLATVAAGGDGGAEALSRALGEPLPELERAFAGWLHRTAAAGGGG